MTVSTYLLKAIACFISVGIFYAIPTIKNFVLHSLQFTELTISILLGMGFGVAGAKYLEKYAKEKKRNKIVESEDTKEFLDTPVGEPCPRCKNKLMMISRLDQRLLYDRYTGLIYCQHCTFEMSKEDWDDGKRGDE